MGEQYLIDSNAISHYLGNRLPAAGMAFMNSVIDNFPKISVITKIEVLSFNTASEYYQLIADLVDAALVLDLSDDVVSKTIAIRKSRKIKTPDAIIAATAAVHELILITHNTIDFANIKGLKIINPHTV